MDLTEKIVDQVCYMLSNFGDGKVSVTNAVEIEEVVKEHLLSIGFKKEDIYVNCDCCRKERKFALTIERNGDKGFEKFKRLI